jgi:LytS/YehU family sensor histidine kinase
MDLEKIRYGQNLNMSLQIQGNAMNKKICPLLLIPFLENSFKHGASEMLTHPWVKLEIAIGDDDLHFNLSNSKPILSGDVSGSKGLGLRNVKKRLAILYPGTHSLNINEDAMSFTILLKVPIFKPDENVEQLADQTQAYELV